VVPSAVLGLGVLGFVVAMALQSVYAGRAIAKGQAGHRPLFPTPTADR
jgi:hypothetical protein